MSTSCLKWPLTLARLGAPCLLVAMCCLMAVPVEASRNPVTIRLLSEAEMTSVVGDSVPQYCLGSFACNTGFVQSSQCAYCDAATTSRTVCCPLSDGNPLCAYNGGQACGVGTNQYTTTTYTTAGCNSCTASGTWTKGGNCDNLKNGTCTTKCSQ